MTLPRLEERDSNLIWHPYSQHGLNRKILPVVSGLGAYLKLEDGREILDAISSWWVNIHGHCNPRIAAAIGDQATKLEHVIFAGFTHEPAVRLAEILTSYPPIRDRGLSKVFYSDNGSTAVEVALKMAYQYHLNRGRPARNRFIALKNSYHGDTLGAMAVGEPEGFHSQFRPLMPAVDFVEAGNLEELQNLIQASPSAHSAFIFEPLVQGAAGMRMYDREYLEKAMRICKENGILTIADEVFTGFFRTGKCFAIEYLGTQPDLLCLSKGITGGFLPLAVTLAQEEIYRAFLSREIQTAFLHGHSYTANPLACRAAVESWGILQTPEVQNRIQAICRITEERISQLGRNPQVHSARCLGTIGAVQMRQDFNYFNCEKKGSESTNNYKDLTGYILGWMLDRKVLLRPLGNVLYSVPPYCCADEEIHRIYDVMEEWLEQ